MKQILSLLIVAFCSCEQKSNSIKTPAGVIVSDNIGDTNIKKSNKKTEDGKAGLAILAWEKREDSLRNEVLKSKEDETLKKSFLQEMYIRNVVRVSNKVLVFTIPFDLHGPDCGAPDCYLTNISFKFGLGDVLIFPKNVRFQEHEYGCIDKERQVTGNFQLVEQTDKHVIYYSVKHKRTLVLFSSNKEEGTTAYYFTGPGQNRINGKNVHRIIEDYDEEDKNSIYPFTSWVLTTNEYENFLHK